MILFAVVVCTRLDGRVAKLVIAVFTASPIWFDFVSLVLRSLGLFAAQACIVSSSRYCYYFVYISLLMVTN